MLLTTWNKFTQNVIQLWQWVTVALLIYRSSDVPLSVLYWRVALHLVIDSDRFLQCDKSTLFRLHCVQVCSLLSCLIPLNFLSLSSSDYFSLFVCFSLHVSQNYFVIFEICLCNWVKQKIFKKSGFSDFLTLEGGFYLLLKVSVVRSVEACVSCEGWACEEPERGNGTNS